MNTITEGEGQVQHVVAGLPELLEKAAIKKDQDGIKSSLVKLDLRIHNNAVQCILHASVHGDTSLMRRLLVDIIDEKSGYRRKGLIAWMRMFTPMELKGDVINLSGLVTPEWSKSIVNYDDQLDQPEVGHKRPFLVELAAKNHFTGMEEARELIAEKPFYKDTVVGRIEAAQRAYKAAVANTKVGADGKPHPIDPKKPFYDGINLDKMDDAFDKIEAILAEVGSWNDKTKEAREAAAALKRAEAEVEAAKTDA
jgi:hypothetical protein